MPDKLPIAVLISGGGTNLQALIDASHGPDFGCEIVGVIADRARGAGAAGLDRAEAAGIECVVVDWGGHPSREKFTVAVCDAAARLGAQALVLAGFMRILSADAIAGFPDRIINVHPSLLPEFPGAHAIEQALASGVDHTGVTVHLVDELVDHGPIIAQSAVPVVDGDTVDTLHARVRAVEHRLLPMVVSAFGRGEITVHDGQVSWQPSDISEAVSGGPGSNRDRVQRTVRVGEGS